MGDVAADLFVGIDCGTSGVRALAIDADRNAVAEAAVAMADCGSDLRAPAVWLKAMQGALTALFDQVDATRVRAVSVDGTSGTLLPIDKTGKPLLGALMYNDAVSDDAILKRIAETAPTESAVHGANSALARFIKLQNAAAEAGGSSVYRILHQADWLAGQLSGRFDQSDQNNSLKTGYDSIAARWPNWVGECGADMALLPAVSTAGSQTGQARGVMAKQLGLSAAVKIVAGTTDGCASFLATGASEAGDAVTALGTTLTIKLLSDKPLFAPEYGIYSHRIGDRWLAGGASNTGGNVLLHYFSVDEIDALSSKIDTSSPSELDYYPLVKPGERFPINDPDLSPRVTPRPDDDAAFLKGLFTGIASVEKLAYERLQQLGAPALKTLRSVGGGASNPVWRDIRHQKLNVAPAELLFTEAAAGTALLAREGFFENST